MSNKRLFEIDAYMAGLCDDMNNSYTTRVDEKFILDNYWMFFKNKLMAKRIPEDQITKEDCIESWRITHWATEVTDVS